MMRESKNYAPRSEFANKANVKELDRNVDMKTYWGNQAQRLDWFQKWDTVLEGKLPYTRWFNHGKINVSYNCLDRHVKNGKGDKKAIIFEGEPGDRVVYSYNDLYREVNKFSNVLKNLGVEKGEIVTIYMPMIPEAVIAMLACTRIGAPHSVVFGGFSAQALADRINDAESKLVITADGYWRRGEVVQSKLNVNDALSGCGTVEKVVVVARIRNLVQMVTGRDYWYDELMHATDNERIPEEMDSEDTPFLFCTQAGLPENLKGWFILPEAILQA